MKLRVSGIPTEFVREVRRGGVDANSQPAVLRRAEGGANPCRHCLGLIAAGEEKLVLSYRPFPGLQPYAETGPIFLHAQECDRYEGESLPAWFAYLQPAIVRGYDDQDWIVYETGKVISGMELDKECRLILERPDVAYVHIRSKFNCFQCRVDRA
jgi:Protein of unknown function (DUF1203)